VVSFLQIVRPKFCTHFSSLSSFLQIWRVKWQDCEAEHNPPSNKEVKNAWSYTSTSPYVFTGWYSIKHMDILTFTFAVLLAWQQEAWLSSKLTLRPLLYADVCTPDGVHHSCSVGLHSHLGLGLFVICWSSTYPVTRARCSSNTTNESKPCHKAVNKWHLPWSGIAPLVLRNQFPGSKSKSVFIVLCSSFSIVNELRAGRQEFGFLAGTGIFFLFATASRQSLRPTQPPVRWITAALSTEVKRPGREADHSPPFSAEVKNAWSYLHSPVRLHDVVCN
jgi:hypothetical protein